MNFDEIKNLKAGDTVGYKRDLKADPVDCLVIQHGPRLDADGRQLTLLGEVLIIQVGSGPTRVQWEPQHFPEGILELVASTGTAPPLVKDPEPPPPLPYPHPPLPHAPTPGELGKYVPSEEELIPHRERTLYELPPPEPPPTP